MLQALLNQKRKLNKFLVSLLLVFPFNSVFALSTDKDQPIEVEADTAELDDQKGISIYTGNVIVIQGSMKVTGDILTVYYNEENELDTLIVEGKPAHYKQLPDNSEIYDEAEALTMEYYNLKNYIILIDDALVIQDRLRSTGSRIEYDTVRNIVKANSNKSKLANDEGVEGQNRNDRVRMILKPRKKE